MRIYLIGFMGSGKTSVGKQLSKSLNMKQIDLDSYIEEKEEMSINEIFELKGEAFFRQVEYKALKTLIIDHENIIISLGGGAACYLDVMTILRGSGVSVYLKLTADQLVERLKHETEQRPLLKSLSNQSLEGYVTETLKERSRHYELAEVIVDASRPISQICDDIIHHLK